MTKPGIAELEMELLDEHVICAGGDTPESHLCVDCGVNTAPGCSTKAEVDAELYRKDRTSKVVGYMRFSRTSEIYRVRNAIWKKAGFSSREIAEKLEISVPTVDTTFWRLRQKLQKILGPGSGVD